MATVQGTDGKTYTLGSSEYTNYLLNYGKPGVAATLPTTQATQQVTSAPLNSPMETPEDAKSTPEDAKLLSMGITQEQLNQMNTPEGMDPTSFQNLIGNVENKLKTNNELVTQRGYLIKQLYDDPLTPEQLEALPEDIRSVVSSGDKDTIELQLRLLNDQISGRANTLSQSIGYLADSYQTHVADVERQKDDAINNVLDFVGQYGSKASQVMSSLYGPTYLEKLKSMGIDIEAMSTVPTLEQIRDTRTGAGKDSDTLGTTSGFLNSKIESSVREDAVALLDEVASGTGATLDSVYKKLRTLYSQGEVSDDALKTLLGMNPTTGTTGIQESPYKASYGSLGGTTSAYGSPDARPMNLIEKISNFLFK